jgi:hypothetical protein
MSHKQQSGQSMMDECIRECQTCHSVCLQMAMNHCLEMGGRHTEPAHFRLMINCAQICQTSADFMLSGSEMHAEVCGVCAEVCQACADSCRQLDGMEMCVQACERCAESCRMMAGQGSGGMSQIQRSQRSAGMQ